MGFYCFSDGKLVVMLVASGVSAKECKNHVWADSFNARSLKSQPYFMEPLIDEWSSHFKQCVMSTLQSHTFRGACCHLYIFIGGSDYAGYPSSVSSRKSCSLAC